MGYRFKFNIEAKDFYTVHQNVIIDTKSFFTLQNATLLL